VLSVSPVVELVVVVQTSTQTELTVAMTQELRLQQQLAQTDKTSAEMAPVEVVEVVASQEELEELQLEMVAHLQVAEV
jgi:hypothetical protein